MIIGEVDFVITDRLDGVWCSDELMRDATLIGQGCGIVAKREDLDGGRMLAMIDHVQCTSFWPEVQPKWMESGLFDVIQAFDVQWTDGPLRRSVRILVVVQPAGLLGWTDEDTLFDLISKDVNR